MGQLAALFRPLAHPRVAYSIAMAVFAFSVIVNAAGVNLRDLRFEDLNPRTWYYRANRSGHLIYARAEKSYYDLRVVYEIESRIQEFRGQPPAQEEAPKPAAPSNGSTQDAPSGYTPDASDGGPQWVASQSGGDTLPSTNQSRLTGAGRRLNP